jgi:hypothetical protein
VPVSRRRRRALLAPVLLLAIPALACRTERDVQRDYARRLQPAPLAQSPAQAPGPIRDLPVRVLADDDYRSDMIRWRARIEAQLERANRVLEAQFAVRLAPTAIEPWARSGRARKLADALAELAEAAPGAGGEWVIAFVSSSDPFSGSLEQLGMAVPFGRHLVVRGMVSFQEGEELRRALDKLSDAERDALLHEREIHRETTVLLHEWAHTLGAFHERERDTIMSPVYGRLEGGFSPAAARIVALGLAHRTNQAPERRAAWARAYRAEVERSRDAAWDEETVRAALGATQALEAAAGPAPAPGGAGPSRAAAPAADEAEPPRSADAAALGQAEMSDRLGDPRRAWALVEPIAARFPHNGPLQQWACHLRRRAQPRASAAAACRAAKPLTARAAAILFSRALANLGDRAGAVEAAIRAEESFARATPPPAANEWSELAGFLARLDACTVAERAAARAGKDDAPEVASHCTRTRQRAALPQGDAGVAPAREPEYIAAVLRGRGYAEAGRMVPARSAAAALEAAFPGAPGGPLVRCLVEARGGDPSAARAACRAADRGPPWPYEPPYVLGMLAGWEDRWADARDQLRRALEREDRDREVWARLAHAHEKLGEQAELERLASRYRARFGGALRAKW